MESRFHVADLPAIYPLVELKDRFNRFVVVLCTAASARIIEMNLGSHSIELLTERPSLRERIGREWTRQHYANHRRERDRQFVKEKISVIENLMAKNGHNSLIVAGDPRHVNQLVSALPAHLKSKLVGEIKTGITDERLKNVLSQAVESFLKAEAEEAHDTVSMLVQAVRARGLATIGVEETSKALVGDQVERLVVSSTLLHEDREELVRLASQRDVPIETVQGCELLDRNGGAGALLRYMISNQRRSSYREPALAE
jgi:stalled ribosome rescue protein Dom34